MMEERYDYDVPGGENIHAACAHLCDIAKTKKCRVTMCFNGVELAAEPHNVAADVVTAFDLEMMRLRRDAGRKRVDEVAALRDAVRVLMAAISRCLGDGGKLERGVEVALFEALRATERFK